jgi:hypothetical protein
MESVRRFAGKTVQVSFVAWVDSGSIAITPDIQQIFGTGGSPSSPVPIDGSAEIITTTPTRFTQSFNMPSIAGKTIGTDGNDYFFLRLKFPTTGTFAVNIMEVQIEEGNVVTPFERVDPGTQLMRCYRYYYRMNFPGAYAGALVGFAWHDGVGNFIASFQVPAPMRATPSAALSSTSVLELSTGALYSITGPARLYECQVVLEFNVITVPSGGVFPIFNNSYDGWLEFDSEL